MNTLTHIVPALSPQVDGVGDYALNLALHLRQSKGISSNFIVCDPRWEGPKRIEGFPVSRLRVRKEAVIWGQLASAKKGDSAVLLHYFGGGYHRSGVPVWLYRGIKSWLDECNVTSPANPRRFSTVFHESWRLPTKPWKINFYLRFQRRKIIEGLHRQSWLSVTGTSCLQAALERIEPHKALWLPMPSNMPVNKPAKASKSGNAPMRVAIFGQHDSRRATVRAHANLLNTMDRKNLLANVMVLGKGLSASGPLSEDVELLRRHVSPERISILGELTPEEVSSSLSQADVFLSHHPGQTACKSGSFMAALAAGCPAVLCDGQNAAPLKESEHFLASNDSQADVKRFERMSANGELELIAKAGRSWYERFADWKVIADRFHEALFEGV